LNISQNQLPSKAGLKLADFIAANKSIVEIDASGNKFGPEVLAKIGNALKTNPSLQTLDLSDNAFGVKMDPKLTKDALAFLASPTSQLKSLGLGQNHLEFAFAEELAKGLRNNSKLIKLVLGGNPLTKGGLLPDSWKDALQNCPMKSLDLSRCSISGAGFKNVLSMYLGELDELIMDGNDPQSEASSLVTFFLSCPLKKLSLNDLKITDDTLSASSQSIGRNKVLEELYLDNNLISMEGVEKLINGLKNNRYLSVISLRNNRFNGESRTASKALLDKTSLEKVIV
jgi:Ran GTPase-activating protein (RanGAP) involved in mRNA processing and transport